MSAWARPGVKVVCVDARQSLGPNVLVEGAVYEIAAVFTSRINSVRRGYGDHLLVTLVGEANPYSSSGGWMAERFRPIVTRTQEDDVALLLRLLTDLPVGEEA